MSSPASNLPAGLSLFHPAGILENAGVKVCIVGIAALRHFGSDLLINDLDLAVAEEDIELAIALLHDNGFEDIDFTPAQLNDKLAMGKPPGWPTRQLHYPQSSDTLVINPAHCWHLDITPDTTFFPNDCPYRFPRFLPYIEALIRVLDTLVSSGDRLWPISYYYAIMEELLCNRPQDEEMLSPADRFFIAFYPKQLFLSGKTKVLELRKRIVEGTITVEDATTIVPRFDLAIKRVRDRLEREKNVPIT